MIRLATVAWVADHPADPDAPVAPADQEPLLYELGRISGTVRIHEARASKHSIHGPAQPFELRPRDDPAERGSASTVVL